MCRKNRKREKLRETLWKPRRVFKISSQYYVMLNKREKNPMDLLNRYVKPMIMSILSIQCFKNNNLIWI